MRIGNLKKMICMVIVFFIMSTVSVSACNSIIFNKITVKDGLIQGTVEAIFQDSFGYIWIGTNDGLSKYDGYDFKTYSAALDNKNGISNNYILSINQDNDKNLWIGTLNGLTKMNLATEEIKKYSSEDSGLSSDAITSIVFTKEGNMLIGTFDGLNIYNEKEDKFERIFNGELSSEGIYSILQDDDGDIWIGTSNGISNINLETKEVVNYNDDYVHTRIAGHAINALVQHEDDILFGGKDTGLFKLNKSTGSVERITKENSALLTDNINSILKDRNNNIWIATDSGIVKYDKKTNSVDTHRSNVHDENSIVNDDVYSLFEDSEGLIWAGTFSGVSTFDPENRIELIKLDNINSNTLSGNMIFGIYEDNDGLIWVGTKTSGINIIDRKNNNSISYINKETSVKLSSNLINDITGYGDTIYIATDEGLNIVNKKDNTNTVINMSHGLKSNNVCDLLLDSKGNLWIGTSKGLNLMKTGTFKNGSYNIADYSEVLDKYGISNSYSGDIFEDSKGNIWFGSFINSGLIKYDVRNNTATEFTSLNGSNLSNDSIRCITEDNDGGIWVGTSLGLNKFNSEEGTFTNYTTNEGLPNNTIYGILIDDENDLWMSTNNGISKFNIDTNEFYNLGIKDGLQSTEFNGRSYFKSKNGDMIFGGINGLNIFNPKNILNDNTVPNVLFEGFEVDGERQYTIDKKTFKYNENNIYTKVFLPQFRNIKSNEFYYSISKSDKEEWTLIEGNSITFSNLSYGDYKLKVKAKNANGIYSEVTTVGFRIKPPFYYSKLAVFIYVLLIIVVITVLKGKVRLLDSMVSLRTQELNVEMNRNSELLKKVIVLEKRKNNYLVNMSHELRTPLNVLYSIQQLINDLNKKPDHIPKDKLNSYMDMTEKNIKRLLKLINDLIDTSKIENGNYKIDIQECDIVNVVEEGSLSLKSYIESKGIDLVIDPFIEECTVECDSVEIERCVVNIIGNAAKFTPAGGEILVTIDELEKDVVIKIKDTGVGIDEKYLEFIFDRFNQVVDKESEKKGGSGLGLTITKNIITLHNGKIYVESKVGEGSTFIIELPKRQGR